MHVRCDNQYKTGADSGNILGQPMLFECMGICVSPAYEYELTGSLVCLSADCKYLFHRFCLNLDTVYKIEQPYRGFFLFCFFVFLLLLFFVF